ncbi:hypothetical protein [Niabella terrae]
MKILFILLLISSLCFLSCGDPAVENRLENTDSAAAFKAAPADSLSGTAPAAAEDTVAGDTAVH